MPSVQQEHDWLIDFGADYVKKQRDITSSSITNMLPKLKELDDIHQKACQTWRDHCDKCCAQGLDPDTHGANNAITKE